jgi:hypothetical protein
VAGYFLVDVQLPEKSYLLPEYYSDTG